MKKDRPVDDKLERRIQIWLQIREILENEGFLLDEVNDRSRRGIL